ncbi:MAG: hypothetical protein H6822_09260 [Planctomycetaceae bacterium]|nr:hypothetical protein [Planctomycetales bacterium]MCB9922359.1 hypothetical protein [Planctomycetaceae bacterium]
MLLSIGVLCILTVAAGSPIRIESSDAGRVVTVIADLDPSFPPPLSSKLTSRQGEGVLTFRLIGNDGGLGAPIIGDYRQIGSQLRFQPRYRLVPECAYRATLYSVRPIVNLDYHVPKLSRSEAAVVENVFPSAGVLPANHLKFYIHFSQPMRETRVIFDRIHLLNEDGSEIPDPWRRTELWTEDLRRLTLWIHPGRVKTGVNLREELGPVLEPNRRYTLVIDAAMQDASGKPLGRRFVKQFETKAADRDRPLPDRWQLIPPTVSTRQAVRLAFNEPLDRALSERFIRIESSQGEQLAGRVVVGKDEAEWSFIPESAWLERDYQVVVNPLLEDLAGNTPERVFDTDLNAPPAPAPVLILPFQARLALESEEERP